MTPTKNNPSFLKIVAWNANSIGNKLQELREFLPRFRVDVALISETHLKPSHRSNIANYKCYRNDRLTGRGGGTAIYIKTNIDHYLLPTPPNLELEATPIIINSAQGKLAIVSCYNPPKNILSRQDITTLFSLANSVIIAGDLNAKHIDWYSSSTNPSGSRLKKLSDDLDFLVNAPTSPTRIPLIVGHRAEVLDIVVYKNAVISPEIDVVHELSSDHLPILFSWGSGHESDCHSVIRRKTSWRNFTELLGEFSLPKNVLNLEDKVTLLEEHVQEALHLSTTSHLVPESFDLIPDEILSLIKARRQAIKLYKRTLAPTHKTAMNKLSYQVRNALDIFRNAKWQEKLEGLQPDNGTLWSLTRSLRRRRGNLGVIRSADTTAVTDQDKAELFAESLYNIASDSLINYPEHLRIIFEMHQNLVRPGTDLTPTTPAELKSIIAGLKPKTAPGLDGISNTAVKFFPSNILDCMTTIINDILTTGVFPLKWKLAKVIVLHKAGKTKSDVNNYRPISLLPTLGKLTERVIHSRLLNQIEELNLIPAEQFGFREFHGTDLQLLRLTEQLHDSFDVRDHAVGVFLDIRRAFDTVWHEGLVAKLYQFNINPNLIRLIESYLNNRSFIVAIEHSISAPRALRAGLPQGSVISPILYNLYTADIPRLDAVSIFSYADDTAFITSCRDEQLAHRRIQTALDAANKYFVTWKLAVHPAKSQHIVFTSRLNLPPRTLTINGLPIPKCQIVKYLGVHFDTKLRWHHHVTQTAKKSAQIMAQLYPLISKSSFLSLSNKLLLYKQVVRPALSYGSIVWGTAAPSTINKLQIQQNKYLRMACGAPKSTNMAFLHEELGIEPFNVFIKRLNTKKLLLASTHSNTLVSDSLNYIPTRRFFRNRPKTVLIPPPVP